MQVKWFGESWGAPINEVSEKVETPVGQECLFCSNQILLSDRGVLIWGPWDEDYLPAHVNCFLKEIVGGARFRPIPSCGSLP